MKNVIGLLVTLLLTSVSIGQTPRLDSLWGAWNSSEVKDSFRLDAIHRYADEGFLYSKPDSAYYFAQLGYELAVSTGNQIMTARALGIQAASWKLRGEIEKSIECNQRALEIMQETGEPWEMSAILNNLGTAFSSKGDYVKAIEYLDRSLRIKEELDDKPGMANTLNHLGSIYDSQQNGEKAFEYYTRSLAISEESGDNNIIATTLIYIGNYYGRKGDFDKTVEYFARSLKLKEELGDLYSVAGITFNLGYVHEEKREFDQALDYYLKSLEIREKMGEKSGIAASLSSIGTVYYFKGDYPKSIEYGEKSLALAREVGAITGLKNSAEHLYNAYKSNGDFEESLEMLELFITLQDSIMQEENQRALIERDVQHKYDQELTIEKAKQERQRIISIAIGIGLLLSLILVWVIFNRLTVTRKQKVMIEEQKQRAEQSEKYKEQFLANMSHEIRTPMHAISGMVKILERNDHLEEQDVYLNAMQTSSENLLVILDDILDLSKIEAGKLEVENIPIQPESVINNVHQILQYKAEEKGLSFKTNIAPDIPEWIMGDPTRLNQILTNLAGNAIKFTEKGSVDISVIRKNEFLIYEVRDTGIGIPQDKQENIFEAFEQADESTTRHYSGTGLGLNITRQLVEIQGGNVWVESKENTGSSLFVSLPLILVDEQQPSKQASQAEFEAMSTALKGVRILIAEDNEFNQMIVQDDLEYYVNDIQLDIASNGVMALEKFKNGNYDLILMDVQMPEMDGYEATMKIRDWEKTNHQSAIPILAMTASVLKSEVNLCFEAGMNNYVPKPYEIEELIGRMYEEVQ